MNRAPHILRAFKYAVLGICVASFSFSHLCFANDLPGTIEYVTGSAVKQGNIVWLKLISSELLGQKVQAHFDGKAVTCFSSSATQCEAVFGVSVDKKAGLYPLKFQNSEGKTLAETQLKVLWTAYPKQNINVSKSTNELKPIAGELEAIQALKESVTPTRYWQTPWMSPTPDCENSPFGVKRYHNGVYINDYHKGVDLRSPMGRPVKAIAGAKVKIATTAFRLHGGTVGLDHGQGIDSIYIHLSKVLVKPGDVVKKGDVVGLVGATGFATGPHLHWGLYANGVPVNPGPWIPVAKCH